MVDGRTLFLLNISVITFPCTAKSTIVPQYRAASVAVSSPLHAGLSLFLMRCQFVEFSSEETYYHPEHAASNMNILYTALQIYCQDDDSFEVEFTFLDMLKMRHVFRA